jgi:hypothetical protein
LIDVRIIRALYQSAQQGLSVKLEPLPHDRKPTREQEITRPPVREREPVNAASPHA